MHLNSVRQRQMERQMDWSPLKAWEDVSSVFSRVWFFATPWIAADQASLSISNLRSPPKSMSIELVMPSNHLFLCCPLLLLPSIFPSIRVFSNDSVLHSKWPKYWSFSFSISPSNQYSGLISFTMDRFDLIVAQETPRVFSSTTMCKHHFFSAQPSLWPYNNQ